MHPSVRQSPNTHRLLQRMPAAVSDTFSPAQIQAIENAIAPRQHTVDVRLLLPFPGRSIYFVFLAGRNRRSHYRDLQSRHSLIMPIVLAAIIAGVGTMFALVHLKGSQLLTESSPAFDQDKDFYPTVVPFKKNQQECEASDRQWVDHQCIDTIHDPTF